MYDPLEDDSAIPQSLRLEVSEAIENNDDVKLQELLNKEYALKFYTQFLHMAIREQKRECFDFLVNHKDTDLNLKCMDTTPLEQALYKSDPYYALTLIKKGVDVNQVQIKSPKTVFYVCRSLLHMTSDVLVVQELILNNVEVNHVCECVVGTPIFKAIIQKEFNRDLFDCLLFYGGDVTIPNKYGDLPFFECPHPEIEEILFNLTFDSVESYEVRFKDFVWLIKRESPFFYHLLELCSSVKYSAYGWDWRVFDNDKKLMMLQTLLDKFKYLTSKLVLMNNPMWRHFDNLPKVMFALDGTDATELMIENLYKKPHYDSSLPYYKLHRPIYDLEAYLQYESTEFIFYLLSIGFSVKRIVMDIIYQEQGFSELFEMLLHMEIVPMGFYQTNTRHIYDLNYKVPKDKKLVKFFHQDKGVPSLMELSREVTRRHLISSFGIKNIGMFLSVVKCLPVPQFLYDVLCYKQPIY